MLNKEKRQKRLAYFAQKHLEKPYQYGATQSQAPRVFDCSSFVQYLYRRIGIDLPRTSLAQAHVGKKVSPENIEPGDLLFIRGQRGHYDAEFPQGIGHVAIYVGEGKIIHARGEKNPDGSESGRVREDPVSWILSRGDLVVIKRIL